MKRMSLAVSHLAFAVVIACLASAGCSESEATTTGPLALNSTTTTQASSVSSQMQVGDGGTNGFDVLASAMAPVPVFGLVELPAGVEPAQAWSPVVEGSPSRSASSEANPRVIGEGGPEPEGQLVLTYGDGWLVVLENVRGDLGDVSGQPVGSIEGAQATLYEVNGGSLVQWGYEGRWYGLFGRNVPEDLVTSLALDMTLL